MAMKAGAWIFHLLAFPPLESAHISPIGAILRQILQFWARRLMPARNGVLARASGHAACAKHQPYSVSGMPEPMITKTIASTCRDLCAWSIWAMRILSIPIRKKAMPISKRACAPRLQQMPCPSPLAGTIRSIFRVSTRLTIRAIFISCRLMRISTLSMNATACASATATRCAAPLRNPT